MITRRQVRVPRALVIMMLVGTAPAMAMAMVGCAGQTLDATVDRGPAELDRPTAWFPLNDGTRIGRNRAAGSADAFAEAIQIFNDPAKGPVADFNAGVLVLGTPVHRDFTVAFWLRTNQQGVKQAGWVMGPRLIDADVGGLALDFGVSLSLDKLVFGVGNPSDITLDQTALQSQRSVVDGTWHHVAVTRRGDSGLRQIFIDGLLDSESTALTGDLVLPATILVGQRSQTVPNSQPLHAQLSDLRFFDRVVSPASLAFLATP